MEYGQTSSQIHILGMSPEEQTGGPTEDFDGKSAAPASQHVVDVKTSGLRVRPPRVLQFTKSGFDLREYCGAKGIRTPDLLDANESRYQLRHSP